MYKYLIAFSILICVSGTFYGQSLKTENVVVITFDGMRWQEVFGGADSALINDSSYYIGSMKELKEKFWAPAPKERREKLFPFFWNTIAANGQLYGNRAFGNKVDNANPYWFSYPGYNEIFTGYPDTAVNSNDKIPNKNKTVLEFLQQQPKFKGKVAAFTSWDCFDAIFNEERSKVYVSAGFDKIAEDKLSSPELKLLNDMQQLSPMPLGDGVRPDLITYFLAKAYIQKHKPKALYIGFDETDDYAHAGKYDYYLNAAHQTDKWLADLWNYLQSQPQYKDKTTMLILTDHGRGDETKSNWKHHGAKIPDAHEIWLAAIGPDTKADGELKTDMQLYQSQVAATIAKLLGLTYTADHPIAEAVEKVYKK